MVIHVSICVGTGIEIRGLLKLTLSVGGLWFIYLISGM